MKIILLLTCFLSSYAYPSFNKNCKKLNRCAEFISKELGVNFLLPKKFDSKISYTKGKEIKKEQYLNIFDHILYQNGFAKIKIDNSNYRIVNARDMRYEAHPQIEVSKENFKEKIPNTYSYVRVVMHAKSNDEIESFVKNSRPFLSRYGRIVNNNKNHTVVIQDTGVHARSMLGNF